MYTQRIPGLGRSSRQTFEFDDEKLIWRTHGSRVGNRELKFAWKDIPAEFHFREIENASRPAQRPIGLIAMIALTFIAAVRNDVNAIWIALLIAALMIITCVIASRILSVRRTEIPTRPPISVHRDQYHDEIVREITSRRRDHFSKMASINIEETARSNLRRLDWLRRIRAITSEDYLAFERELAPANRISERSKVTLPTKHFHQEQIVSWVDFEMKADHFTYERLFVGWGRCKFNFDYAEIRSSKEIYRNLAFASAFAFALYMSSALCVVALDLWINPGPTQNLQAIFLVALGLFWIGIITGALCIFPVRVIMAGLYALEEKSGSASDILHELEIRRRAARKEQFLQSCIFLTKKERESRLSDLKRDDVLSELDFHEFVALTENIDEIWLSETASEQKQSLKPVLH